MSKITAIYVRRSVSDKDKDNNSLSIDSQKAECVKSLKEGEEYRIYCDDGKSAKDMKHRPAFMQMMSDADVYQYLVSSGYELIDDIEAYDGVHGLFKHKKLDKSGHYIKVGYREGIVDSETWLMVQDKKSQNQKVRKNKGAKNSWLIGLIKCSHCGYGIIFQCASKPTRKKRTRYLYDHGAYRANGCVKKRLQTTPDQLEQAIFDAMAKRIESLTIAMTRKAKPDNEAENIKVDIIRIENEIRKLMGKLADADNILFGYINGRVKELHAQKSDFEKRLRSKARKQKEIDTAPLSDPLSRWDSLTVAEKNTLAKIMIDAVYISDESGIDIRFAV